jgi:hypothetical protein
MNEGWTAEDFQQHREQEQRRKQSVRDENVPHILRLRELGYVVRQLTPFQFRINEDLDIFPTSRKFHFLPSNQRGRINCSFEKFVKQKLG